MKKFSIEQKAQRYGEALKKAKDFYKGYKQRDNQLYADDLESIFPELKEDGNERVRKWLIMDIKQSLDDNVYNDESIDSAKEALAWLEKQGQTFTQKDVDDAYLKGISDTKNELEKQGGQKTTLPKWKYKNDNIPLLRDSIILNKYGCVSKSPSGALVNDVWILDYDELAKLPKEEIEKQGEQKHTDKPKFHKGEWIVHQGTDNVYQVVAVIDNQYQLKYGDNYTVQKCADVDRCARLWDITKDAKDGDALAVEPIEGYYLPFIAIYKEGGFDFFNSHCFIGFDGIFYNEDTGHSIDNIHPATKEQRDTLERAMADAGYTFDFDKKELKKIEYPEYSKDNLSDFESYLCLMFQKFRTKGICTNGEIIDFVEKHVQKLKDTLCSTWNEEDESMALGIEQLCNCASLLNIAPDKIDKIRTWLKSLKERYTWKPSDAQMASITCAVRNMKESACYDSELVSLLNDLKNLK